MAGEFEIRRGRFGERRVHPVPSADELAAYYNTKYFAGGSATRSYAAAYAPDDLAHRKLSAREILHLRPTVGRAFEVGVGEGFVLAELAKRGWAVRGIDFTADGLLAQNPHLAALVELGDAFALLDAAIEQGRRYDLVICNHVLEHVGDPEGLLNRMRRLLVPDGVCRIVVPNDGSWLHEMLAEDGAVDPDFYVAYPDHLQYFTAPALTGMLGACGYRVREMLGEFPIDFFLLHPDSNYMADRSKGKAAHRARVRFETTLADRSIADLLAFRRGCAAAGVGRTIVVYAELA